MVGLIKRNDGSMDMTSVVCLFKLEEVRAQNVLLSLRHCQVRQKHGSEIGSDHPVQGETLNSIVLRKVSLEIPEVL